MARQRRRQITGPEALETLAHPVRLELINHLMVEGPATASACARAVGDTPSSCSCHLRVLTKVGVVGEVDSDDGRERPWRALITGFETEVESEGSMAPKAAELLAVSSSATSAWFASTLPAATSCPGAGAARTSIPPTRCG
jgi:hypothetical protein